MIEVSNNSYNSIIEQLKIIYISIPITCSQQNIWNTNPEIEINKSQYNYPLIKLIINILGQFSVETIQD